MSSTGQAGSERFERVLIDYLDGAPVVVHVLFFDFGNVSPIKEDRARGRSDESQDASR